MELIPVCSGKGGTGKSCVCVYTAAAMAALGKKTLLADMGTRHGSLPLITGMQDAAVFHLGDVLRGECEPEKAIIDVTGCENLSMLPAGEYSKSAENSVLLAETLKRLGEAYEFVFLDNPDFSVLDAKDTAAALLVTTPDSLSVDAASRTNTSLYEAGFRSVRLVINSVPANVVPMSAFRSFDDIIDKTAAQLISVIPESQKLHHSANNGFRLSGESLCEQIFRRMALRLLGKHAPLLVR